MDMLKNDLRAIQGGVREVLGASGGRLSVPSWKFPSKQAVEVDIDEVLKNCASSTCTAEGEDVGHVQQLYLLELIVDRLLFLLQCCISLSDQTLGQRSSNLPLTLGSTVKKFSKRMLQSRATVKDMQKKISSKDATISSLTSMASKLRDDYSHLEHLHQKSGHKDSVAIADEELALSRPSTSASSCVPYEAMGTLKINSFTILPTEVQSTQKNSLQLVTSSLPLSKHEPSTSKSSSPHSLHPASQQATVSTQTTDTAFALCVRCSGTQDTLLQVTDSVSALCREQDLQSSMDTVDWKALAQVDGLELSKWRRVFQSDLCVIGEHCCRMKEKVAELELERDGHKVTAGKLESEIEQLSSQMDSLQESVEDIQKKNEISLSKSKESFSSQLRQLEQARDKLKAKSLRMKEELNSTRRQEAHLRSLVAEIEHRRGQLQIELEAMQGREMQLSAAKHGLEEELKCSKNELETCRDHLQDNQLELSKNKVYSHTLEKRNKSLQSKQASLLSRLDELDQDCSGLREELDQVEGSRRKLKNEVEDMQKHCNDLQHQLQTEQDMLAQSHVEQDNLIQIVSELEGQLGEVRVQLDQEKHNCHLLMDYPFIKQVSGDYHSHIASLTRQDSEKQVSANTIRILLLEEQNSELREKRIPQRETKRGQSHQVRQATPLWRKAFLSQLQEEQMLAQDLGVSKPRASEAWNAKTDDHDQSSTSPHNDRQRQNSQASLAGSMYGSNMASSSCLDEQRHGTGSGKNRTRVKSDGVSHGHEQSRASTAKLKGRLGHLVAAIAESHTSSSSSHNHLNSNLGGGGGEVSTCNGGQTVKAEPSPHVHSNTWIRTNSSLDSVEVCMCSKCDRMFSGRGELEQHQALCPS